MKSDIGSSSALCKEAKKGCSRALSIVMRPDGLNSNILPRRSSASSSSL